MELKGNIKWEKIFANHISDIQNMQRTNPTLNMFRRFTLAYSWAE